MMFRIDCNECTYKLFEIYNLVIYIYIHVSILIHTYIYIYIQRSDWSCPLQCQTFASRLGGTEFAASSRWENGTKTAWAVRRWLQTTVFFESLEEKNLKKCCESHWFDKFLKLSTTIVYLTPTLLGQMYSKTIVSRLDSRVKSLTVCARTLWNSSVVGGRIVPYGVSTVWNHQATSRAATVYTLMAFARSNGS